MKTLEGSVNEMKGDGFFAGTVKAPTGAARKQQALAGYNAGKEAVNEYVKIANDGLMLELNKLDSL